MSRATRRRAVFVARAWIVSFLLVSAARDAFPQTALAAVIGSVRDSQGKPVPDAVVKVEQQETMLTRQTRTTGAGVYAITALPIGTYSVFISHAGFSTAESRSLRLLVGQTRTVNGNLRIAPRNEQLVVAADVSEIQQTAATIGGRIDQTQIQNLPINGRNWATLLPLIPGAVDPGTSDQRSVRFAGHGRDDNNFSFDGVDAGGISNQPQKSAIRLAIPTSAISEFKVDSTLYTADSADGTGAQIILASKGGTNTFHGNGFDFLRNDVFDARNPFSRTTPPFRLNQFGANLGGPVIHNNTFLFVAYEGLRQRLDQTLQGFVPSASYRAQVISRSSVLAPVIDAFPSIGSIPQANNPSIDLFNGLSPQIDNEDSGMVRIDHRFSNAVTSFLRVNVDEAVTDVPLSNLRDRQVADYRPINAILNITQVLSPTLLNETKFGFNQVFSRTSSLGALPYTLSVSGFTSLPGSSTREEDDSSASIQDDVSFTHGRHTVKAGVRVRRVFTDPGSSASGTLTYVSRNTLADNQLDRASVTDALPLKRLRKTQAFGFIQDEYKATASLTFNLGLRYQFFNVFHETDGRAIPFDFATCGGFCQPGAEFSDPRKNDLDPRIAVAWAPKLFNNKTVFRAGFGIYHGDGQLEDQNLPASNDVLRYSLNSSAIRNLSYPILPFLATTPGTLSPRAQNRNRKDEYSSQWGFSVQQELAQRLTATISYFGNKGTFLQTITTANVADPLTGLRPYPQYGQVEYRTNDSNSTFHALQLSVQQKLSFGTSVRRELYVVPRHQRWFVRRWRNRRDHATKTFSAGPVSEPTARKTSDISLQQTRSTIFPSALVNIIFPSRACGASLPGTGP